MLFPNKKSLMLFPNKKSLMLFPNKNRQISTLLIQQKDLDEFRKNNTNVFPNQTLIVMIILYYSRNTHWLVWFMKNG